MTVDYSTDGDGLRQTRTTGGTTTNLLWDVSGSLPLPLDDGTHSYIYGPSAAPLAQIDDSTGTIQYLHGDLIGSTRQITSSTGTAVGTTEYDPYGNRTGHTGTADSTIGYSGNLTDPSTGLVYLRARDYDPTTAQFLTVDPAVDSTRQPYAYVTNDPLGSTDPTGLCDAPGAGPGLCTPEDFGGASWMLSPGALWVGDQLKSSGAANLLRGIGDGATANSYRDAIGDVLPNAYCGLHDDGFYTTGQYLGAIGTLGVGFIPKIFGAFQRLLSLGRVAGSTADAASNLSRTTLSPGEALKELTPQGLNVGTWGNMIWGTGEAGAKSLIGSRSATELAKIPGLNAASATALRDIYVSAISAGKGGATAPVRVELLNEIIAKLGAQK